jgi:hypothetical protein
MAGAPKPTKVWRLSSVESVSFLAAATDMAGAAR